MQCTAAVDLFSFGGAGLGRAAGWALAAGLTAGLAGWLGSRNRQCHGWGGVPFALPIRTAAEAPTLSCAPILAVAVAVLLYEIITGERPVRGEWARCLLRNAGCVAPDATPVGLHCLCTVAHPHLVGCCRGTKACPCHPLTPPLPTPVPPLSQAACGSPACRRSAPREQRTSCCSACRCRQKRGPRHRRPCSGWRSCSADSLEPPLMVGWDPHDAVCCLLGMLAAMLAHTPPHLG